MVFDVLVRGGRLVDGGGGPVRDADLAIDGGRIAEVGRLSGASARQVVDAAGMLLLPGLIDMHVHADGRVADPDVQLAALRQGVTTVVLGQDGLSFAPAPPRTLRYTARYFAPVNGPPPVDPVSLPPAELFTVADLLAGYRHATALNTAYLVPHGTVRHAVLGTAARPAAPDELAAMDALVRAGLDEGAVGVSSGLEYAPGRHADVAELAALAAAAGRRGLPYVTHQRGYEERVGAGLAESLDIARRSGAPLHVSHLHGPAEEILDVLDAVAAELDVTFDSYPYLSGCSILALVALPDRLRALDPDTCLARLADPAERARLDTEWFPALAAGWPTITLNHLPSDRLGWAEGRTVADAAGRAGTAPGTFVLDVLRATGLRAGAVFAQPPSATDTSVRALLRHPAQLGGSDGIYVGGHPHPRGWGAFARFLARHVRELGDWTWPQAAVHLAAAPARRFRLAGRGVLRRGAYADVVMLDPVRVQDVADYATPTRYARGVAHVWVNGTHVLDPDGLTGALPGEPLAPT